MVLWQRPNYERALLHKLDDWLFLQRVEHNLVESTVHQCHSGDEAVIEGGVNAQLSRITAHIHDPPQARRAALRYFMNRTDPEVRQIIDIAERHYPCSYERRQLGDMLLLAEEVIVDLVLRVARAEGGRLPRRVRKPANARKGHKCDAWEAPTLCEGVVYSHEIGSPAFALFVENESADAPDGWESAIGCHERSCEERLEAPLHKMQCGHLICTLCGGEYGCPKCRKQLRKTCQRIALSTQHGMRDRIIMPFELKMTEKANRQAAPAGAEAELGQPKDPSTHAELLRRLAALSP